MLVPGMGSNGPAYLGVTSERVLYFCSCPHGCELNEIRLRQRPALDTLKRDDGWTITASADPRTVTLRGTTQQSAARFSEVFDAQVAALGVDAETWQTVAADSDLWDEMRHYLDGDEDEPDGHDVAGLQQAWIEQGALKPESAWWPPSASTIVWLLPLLLLMWMIHTVIISTSGAPGARASTSALIRMAQRGDGWALSQLSGRVLTETNVDDKIAIVHLVASHRLSGAAGILLQDLFTHDSAGLRRAEIEALFELDFGRELAAALAKPGDPNIKKALLDDIGAFGNSTVVAPLKEYFPFAEPELRPALLLTLARLGQSDFLVTTYETGSSEAREWCLEAAYSLPRDVRRSVLQRCLAFETASGRRKQLEELIDR